MDGGKTDSFIFDKEWFSSFGAHLALKTAKEHNEPFVLIDFSLTVKAATLIFISGRGSAISSAKEGKSGFIYNLVKSK